MSQSHFYDRVDDDLKRIVLDGLLKPERQILSSQSAEITVSTPSGPKQVLNFCGNNYLGLANHPALIEASRDAQKRYGFGLASVRFICGTQDLHRRLEQRIAAFLGYEDAITFAACFDANGGVFEPLLTAEDAIISDSLNHASIIDGVRLCKAQRYRFANRDMQALERCLQEADRAGLRTKLIVTDGVFSMDGFIADLASICGLARKYDALVMVDDCHATGVIGAHGRGTAEYCNVEGQVDILTGTFGKALGGGMGGFICAKQNVIDLLKQRARPYLFSNALAPGLVAGAIAAIDILEATPDWIAKLKDNAALFRDAMSAAGFSLLPGKHPIVPVMLGDAQLAQQMAEALLEAGVYVTGFSYPVVPVGEARIRTQLSAAHTPKQIEKAVNAFIQVGGKLGAINSPECAP